MLFLPLLWPFLLRLLNVWHLLMFLLDLTYFRFVVVCSAFVGLFLCCCLFLVVTGGCIKHSPNPKPSPFDPITLLLCSIAQTKPPLLPQA